MSSATVVPPDSDVGRDTFLVLSPPPSLPSTCSLFVEEAYRADIGTALKFLVAIDKLNIPEQVLLSKRLVLFDVSVVWHC
jgi:hypothetical protein